MSEVYVTRIQKQSRQYFVTFTEWVLFIDREYDSRGPRNTNVAGEFNHEKITKNL